MNLAEFRDLGGGLRDAGRSRRVIGLTEMTPSADAHVKNTPSEMQRGGRAVRALPQAGQGAPPRADR